MSTDDFECHLFFAACGGAENTSRPAATAPPNDKEVAAVLATVGRSPIPT